MLSYVFGYTSEWTPDTRKESTFMQQSVFVTENAIPTSRLYESEGLPFPAELRFQLERVFQKDLSAIRFGISDLPFQLNARALAFRNRVLFTPGLYQPGTRAGAGLVAHEVCHALQQMDSRIRLNPPEVRVLADSVLEIPANRAEEIFVNGFSLELHLNVGVDPSLANTQPVVQCKPVPKDGAYTDTRNTALVMKKTAEDTYSMPDGKLYRLSDNLLEHSDKDDKDLYVCVNSQPCVVYDPVGLRRMAQFKDFDSKHAEVNKFYYPEGQHQLEWYQYVEDGLFDRHDLISNFRAWDLLYGIEKERRRVRRALMYRTGEEAPFITADDIHKVVGITGKNPTLGAFDDFFKLDDEDYRYEEFLRNYGGGIDDAKGRSGGAKDPERYHPEKAARKSSTVSKSDVRLRRSCKALMVFMMQHRNSRIHFIIDDIDPDKSLFTYSEARHVNKLKLYNATTFFAYSKGKSCKWALPFVGDERGFL